MEPAKTISVVCPENVRAGYKNIPAIDFDPAIHTLFDVVGKPVDPSTSGRDAPAVPIPADWQSLHWKQRVALAEKLTGDLALALAGGQKPVGAADAVIAAEVARRAEG
ncbi:hypothetical protein V5F77_05145 [Xanthobacter sp. DSM 24535]|uniref:hypothetical protein n=1 Tax=Roseixanthobacter psychrophilus TaxID=3119917 RepID=UPI0037292423